MRDTRDELSRKIELIAECHVDWSLWIVYSTHCVSRCMLAIANCVRRSCTPASATVIDLSVDVNVCLSCIAES